jgi:hypothetical protein
MLGRDANRWSRGSFDRGDLKEIAGATGRAMEPQGVFDWFRHSHSGDGTVAETFPSITRTYSGTERQ